MLHRTKYNRFRNESVTSVDELLHSKVSAAPTATAAPPYPTSAEVLHADQEDGPTTLCTLIHKVSHLKFSGTGSLSGIKNLSSAVKDLAISKLQGSSSAPSTTAGAVDNTCNPASTTLCSQQDMSKMSTGKKTKLEEMHLGGEDWNQIGSVVSKPSRGWLHSNEKILGPGVTYIVKYLGCIEVLRSMRSLDFNTRTQITSEAISRVCEAVPGAKGAFYKKKPPSKALSSILGKSNPQFAGMSITLNISTSSLNLMTPDSKQIIANHHMQSISFASGGDPDMTDYVAYVAKDPVNRRACHILECCEGLAQDVICTIGQAFELRFKQYLQCPSKLPTLQDRMLNLEEPAWTEEEEEETAEHPYYNSIPGKIPPLGGFNDVRMKNQAACPTDGAQPTTMTGRDQTYYQGRHLVENQSDDRKPAPVRQGSSDVICQPEGKTQLPKMGEVATYVNTQHIDVQALVALQANSDTVISGTAGIAKDSPRKDIFDMKPFEDAIRNRSPVLNKTASIDNSSPLLARAAAFNMKEELKSEPWYHGEMSRKEAEQLLKGDGDFLVRKSTTNPGSYVLTGMHNGHSKHLLLVDPEGAVRTKDHIFESISHLISHHRDNNLPIVSAGSELCLKQPVKRRQ
ncbi:SHC-transforming protein 3-like isoform X1 [Polyodon spathula]|uniref:SHC-transforming protein 3-like isoform X1 n=2 Tax=Polyodon spathula TaxID=7913 RepID=UPI001B7EFF38|nr:SHC-transforming protein 3-like isoform X1 [Polyodon spathula]